MDNPEYHMTGDEPNAVITSVSSSGTAVSAVTGTTSVGESQSPIPTTPGRSLEDDSDHDYYNDFDRLQRELQPLRRNETTV